MASFGLITGLQLARQLGVLSSYDSIDFSYMLFGIMHAAELAFACLYPSFRPIRWRGIVVGLAAFPVLMTLLILGARTAGAEALLVFALQSQHVVREFVPPVSLAILA